MEIPENFKPSRLILVSACLLGQAVRWDGKASRSDHPTIRQLVDSDRAVAICPESMGLLPTPRTPAERQHDNHVIARDGTDVTAAFQMGAQATLDLCLANNVNCVILKSKSPSCGLTTYDGTFSGTIDDERMGVTAQLLQENGVVVLNETSLNALPRDFF